MDMIEPRDPINDLAKIRSSRDALPHGRDSRILIAAPKDERHPGNHGRVRAPWYPTSMRIAPTLDASFRPQRIKKRHALLLNPFYPKDPHASFGKHVLTPSLALTSIAATTPEGWTVQYWDENLLQGPPPVSPFPEIVGITVHLTFARRAYELAHWFRDRGAKIIFGGLHVLSCPEECAQHADALAFGEGVQVWGRILRDADTGNLQRQYVGSFVKPYRDDPTPRRELVHSRDFLTTTSLIATRGCHNRCDFCYLSTKGSRIPYQCRDIEQVLGEFGGSRQPYAVFVDNNLGSKPEYLRHLCRALRPLERIWSAAVSLDVTDRPDVVREMALAGCTGVFIGFESLHPDNITGVHKKSPRPADYARRVGILHDNGIQVNGSFVLGFDHDRSDVFEQTVQWIESNHLECATFHILTPYPGTPLFAQMEEEGRILHKDWSLFDTGHAVFRPNLMTAEELEEGYHWCYRRLFSHASIWERRPARTGAVIPYLAMSYLYKRSNWLWYYLIRLRLTGWVWRPLIEWTRWRHAAFRKKLSRPRAVNPSPSIAVSAGVHRRQTSWNLHGL